MSRVHTLTTLSVAALLLIVFSGVVGCGPTREDISAEITSLETPEGVIQPGTPATVSVRIENTGTERHRFWIGYSVRDSAGRWYDAPTSPVELAAGEDSGAQELSTEPLEMPGYYDTRVSVWSEEPEGEDAQGEAQRLADAQETSAFRISAFKEDFDSFDEDRWAKPAKELGRGNLDPANVEVRDGQLRIKLPADTLDGGEIESKDLHGNGFYAARIKVPDAPSSITGFFLYAPPDLESEIDIEIFNDSSRKILFTTYASGKQTHSEEMELPFDPTGDFHDYAFFYGQTSITFYVDGEPMRTFEGGLPDGPMNLYVNSWFPTWLAGQQPASDRYVDVDWIEH